MITLTEGQRKGLEVAVNNYKNNKPFTVISGYAGTGKSTLVAEIIKELGLSESSVCFAAYTGKAANVLRLKGNENSITLHKLMYNAVLQPNGEYTYTLVDTLDYKLIVVDECSMVPKKMVEDLLSFGVHIIFLGDSFQLPPIDEDSNNHLLDTPDVMLQEIMRQAADSNIIQLGDAVRHMETIPYFRMSDVAVINNETINNKTLLWADEIICATNKTRQKLNERLRALNNRGDLPEVGDKIICLHNYWEICSFDDEMPLTNGTIGYIISIKEAVFNVPSQARKFVSKNSIPVLICDIKSENGSYSSLVIDKNELITGEKSFSTKDEYYIAKAFYQLEKNGIRHMHMPMDFNYGYAITCHKAQGSEWNNIVIFEERFPFDKEDHAHWIYTAITRASEKIVLVK